MTTLASPDSVPQGAPPDQIQFIKQKLQVINEHKHEKNEEEEEEDDEDEDYDHRDDLDQDDDGSSTQTTNPDDEPHELKEVSFDNSQNIFKRKPLDPILDQCDTNPDFAIICSFISQFGDILDLVLDIEQLKSSIENQTSLDDGLVEIHIKLLKKVHRYFVRDLWEKALVRYIATYSYQDAWELEELGYIQTRISIKLQLLVRLLEAQFQVDPKLKAHVGSCDEYKLRIEPMGRDNKGNTYWKQTDKEGNFRIFQEEPLNYKNWKTVCAKPEELNYLIDELEANKMILVKGQPLTEPYNPLPEIFPDLFIVEENNNVKEEEPSMNNHNNHHESTVCGQDEDTIEEPVIEKRTRTARGRSVAVYKEPEAPIEEDDPCSYCDKSNDPELILLCDNCDAGYHISCCLPPLMIVPEGDWYCPTCEHRSLLTKLKSFYRNILKVLKEKEIERMRLEKKKLQENKKRKQLEQQKKLLEAAKKERSEQVPAKKRQKGSNDTHNEPIGLDELDEILGVETDEEEEQMSSYSNETDAVDKMSSYSSETDELRERGSSYLSETEEEEDQMSLYSGDTEEEEEQMSLYSSEGTVADFSIASDGTSNDERRPAKKSKHSSKKVRKDSSDSYESDQDYQEPSRKRRRAAATNICYKASSDEEDEIISYARSQTTTTGYISGEVTDETGTNGLVTQQVPGLEGPSNQEAEDELTARYQEPAMQEVVTNQDRAPSPPFHPPFYGPEEMEP